MRVLYRYVGVGFCALFALARAASCDPTQEITRAATSTSTTGVAQVPSETFVASLTSILASVKGPQLDGYVTAAVTLRPDLQTQIVVAALDVRIAASRGNRALQRAEVTRIVRAALTAARGDGTAIIVAATKAYPDFYDAIFAGATSLNIRETVRLAMVNHSAPMAGSFRGDGSPAELPPDQGQPRRHGNNDDNRDVNSPEKAPPGG